MSSILSTTVRAVVGLALFALLVSCGNDTECIEGQHSVCPCPGGVFGTQTCAADGTFDACDCSSPFSQGTPDGSSDDADGGSDTDDAESRELNACNGEIPLNQDPGTPCGDCNDGVLVCSGPNSLRCVGATDTNACGGCESLSGAPDESCGPCKDGVWGCNAAGGIDCTGATVINGCGGCDPLNNTPNFSCGSGTGFWACSTPDNLVCVGPGDNRCGGSSTLSEIPGTPCGRCLSGTWVCDGTDSVLCQNPQADVNDCGGCAPLEGAPGTPCGDCGGAWRCDGTERVVCDAPINLCGGCTDLTSPPGEFCDNGDIYACNGSTGVACADPNTTNECGGKSTLGVVPGDTCGPCGRGRQVCISPELTECVGASEVVNECGGCTELLHQPGTFCAPGSVWTCDGTDFVTCEIEGPTGGGNTNACGGTGTLAGQPGDTCESCGTWTCDAVNPDVVFCLGGSPGLDSDPQNCGRCGNRCLSGEYCSSGTCTSDAYVAVEAGITSTCALKSSGQLRCWGSNGSGELGNGSTTSKKRPTAISGFSDVTDFSVGDYFACALRANQTVWCWGYNAWSQVGSGTGNVLSPAQVPGVTGAVDISAGYESACAVLDTGEVWCWGRDEVGQLGRGTVDSDPAPAAVTQISNAQMVEVASGHACALLASGQISCWGSDTNEELGNGDAEGDSAVPTPVLDENGNALSGMVDLLVDDAGGCAVTQQGTALCWGLGSNGQAGTGSSEYRLASATNVRTLTDILDIDGSSGHRCATTNSGELYCWGQNSFGELGLGDKTLRYEPNLVGLSNDVTDVGAGDSHTCAVGLSGRIYCAGDASSANANRLADNQVDPTTDRTEFVPSAFTPPYDSERSRCHDGVDNDRDGAVDCLDDDCSIDLASDVGALVWTGMPNPNGGNYMETSCGTFAGKERLFRWTAPVSGRYAFSTDNSTMQNSIELVDSCNSQFAQSLACDDAGMSAQTRVSRMEADVVAGTTYFVAIHVTQYGSDQPIALSIERLSQ